MDTKAIMYNKKKCNELAAQHNRLTTLCAGLLNEVIGLKKRVDFLEQQGGASFDSANRASQPTPKYGSNNFNDLKADDILRQLSVNTVPDN